MRDWIAFGVARRPIGSRQWRADHQFWPNHREWLIRCRRRWRNLLRRFCLDGDTERSDGVGLAVQLNRFDKLRFLRIRIVKLGHAGRAGRCSRTQRDIHGVSNQHDE
jgi:hypothetical protein